MSGASRGIFVGSRVAFQNPFTPPRTRSRPRRRLQPTRPRWKEPARDGQSLPSMERAQKSVCLPTATFGSWHWHSPSTLLLGAAHGNSQACRKPQLFIRLRQGSSVPAQQSTVPPKVRDSVPSTVQYHPLIAEEATASKLESARHMSVSWQVHPHLWPIRMFQETCRASWLIATSVSSRCRACCRVCCCLAVAATTASRASHALLVDPASPQKHVRHATDPPRCHQPRPLSIPVRVQIAVALPTHLPRP